MMSIYFRTYRENGTPKPVKSWAVLGYPVIPTEKSGQRGRCKVTNNTVGNKQIEANMCVSENFYQSYFGPIKDMFFSADVICEQNICPYIFLNTQLNFLSLSGITNSLLFKNRLSFLTLNQNQTKLKTSLIVLTFVIVYEKSN